MPQQLIIPGYEEALASERRAREEAYLDAPHFICGVKLRQITPRILARLFAVETPFLGAGEQTDAHAAQFLWACHWDYTQDIHERSKFLKYIRGIDYDRAVLAVREFIKLTFIDAPTGSDGVPYVCSLAWFEYAMHKVMGWPSDYTLDQPMRRIYQLIRCQQISNGDVMVNRISDKVRGDWLASIQHN